MKKSILILALAGLTAGAFAAPIHSSKVTSKAPKKEVASATVKPAKEVKEVKTKTTAVKKTKAPEAKAKTAKVVTTTTSSAKH